jgi:hypothetical protein
MGLYRWDTSGDQGRDLLDIVIILGRRIGRLRAKVNPIAAALIVGFVVLAGTYACMNRYETVKSYGVWVIIRDRWTGTVTACAYPPGRGPICRDATGG